LNLETIVHPNNWLNDLDAKQWIKATPSWVIIDARGEPGWDKKKLHPATFPISVPEHFIPIFSKKQHTILDPFAGTGSTLIAASKLGRYSIGIDLQQKYSDLFDEIMSTHYLHPKQTMLVDTPESRLHRWIWSPTYRVGHCIQEIFRLPERSIDYIFTSPPYSNALRSDPNRTGMLTRHKKRIQDGLDTHYSEDSVDMGNLELHGDWLDMMVQFAIAASTRIKNGRFMSIVIQNLMGIDFQPIAWELAQAVDKETPWRFAFEMLWLQSTKPARIHGHPSRFLPSNHHHYVLNFQHTED
jgi:16S rRNA G966 N2-methylase RsmD